MTLWLSTKKSHCASLQNPLISSEKNEKSHVAVKKRVRGFHCLPGCEEQDLLPNVGLCTMSRSSILCYKELLFIWWMRNLKHAAAGNITLKLLHSDNNLFFSICQPIRSVLHVNSSCWKTVIFHDLHFYYMREYTVLRVYLCPHTVGTILLATCH